MRIPTRNGTIFAGIEDDLPKLARTYPDTTRMATNKRRKNSTLRFRDFIFVNINQFSFVSELSLLESHLSTELLLARCRIVVFV